jgi:hypothetical protein
MFKLYFLTSVADLVASVTLNYQLIQNFYLKIKTRVQILKNNIKTRFIRALAHSSHTKLSYGSFSTLGTRAPNQPYKTRSLIYYFFIYYFFFIHLYFNILFKQLTFPSSICNNTLAKIAYVS